MESRTKTGLLLLIIGSIIAMVSNVALFFSGGVMLALSAIGGIGGLCSFIGIILLIIGRKEFGEKHSKFVIYALILFILAFVIPTIVIAGVTFSYVTQSMGGNADPSFIQNIFFIIPLASIIGGLAYVFLLYELENKIGRMVLFAGFAVYIITSVVIALSIGSAFEETLGSIDFENTNTLESSTITNEFTQKISSTGLYGIANGVLMLIALIIPYNRITSGELVPVLPATQTGEPERRCPNCGRPIPMDANICPYCSKKFEDYL